MASAIPTFYGYPRPDGTFGNRIGDWTDVIDLDYSHPALWDYQIETLQKLHCDVLQGFRFCVPLPAAEAGRRILEQARPGACADSQEG